MIDIENLVYSEASQAIRAQFGETHPNLVTYSTTPNVPEGFPCVVIEMVANTPVRRAYTFGNPLETYADITFQTDVYTNNGSDAKQTAKEIFDYLDEYLQQLGFVRTLASPTPNIDRTIYRITGRYIGRSDAGKLREEDGEEVIHFTIFKS